MIESVVQKMNGFLPNQFWQAYQLGLYEKVCQQKFYLPIRQIKTIRQLAALKRFAVSEPRFMIGQLLDQHQNDKWFKIIIKELSPVYPKIVFDYLQNHFDQLPRRPWLSQIYFALSLEYGQIRHELMAELDSDERLLFLSNLTIDRQQKRTLFNEYLQRFDLLPLTDGDGFALDAFEFLSTDSISSPHQVTILVTAFNAAKTITSCLKSLLSQSWQNIQVIVIDDASTDDTTKIIHAFVKQDKRITGIYLPKNVGTFVAKRIGASFATGEFLTCQDSDDFAHPQKIERQVLPLIDHPELIATTSHWLRLDECGRFYARQYYPFLRQNPASPLFRRQQVEQKIGLWHLVRTGADSEFWHRLKLHYGDDRIMAIKEPLTIASHRADSLMNAGDFGVHDKASALRRLDYWEAWNLWHIACLSKKRQPTMPSISEQIINPVFEVDERLLVNPDDIRYNLENLTIEKQDD